MRAKTIMQVTDTLVAGGLERVAVNIANSLARESCRSFLCTTRTDGPLDDLVSPNVGRLRLVRRGRYDLMALRRLVQFIRTHEVDVLHAHGTSLFISVFASMFAPFPKVIWHDHYGLCGVQERPGHLYRLAAQRISAVITVNHILRDWSVQRLGVKRERVSYIPNFVCWADDPKTPLVLPGVKGSRIVCLANMRPQKDHHTLLRAMILVVSRHPQAHLLLIGMPSDETYLASLRQFIVGHDLEQHVTFLGTRIDAPHILHQCDIGVLSSASEGLPLALLDYGHSALPVVVTNVGQCKEVIDEGRLGKLVPPGDAQALALAIQQLLESPEERVSLGVSFREFVMRCYSEGAAMRKICEVYESILPPG